MNHIYNQNHTRFEIEVLLNKIKHCAVNNHYLIAQNEHRLENIAFINEYHICAERQKSLLALLRPEDFCYSIQNQKSGHEDEILYVFVPKIRLYNNRWEPEELDLYLKFNMLHMKNHNQLIIISFHKLNKPIEYLFR